MGVQHGFGEITLTNGKVRKGKFENNKYIAKLEDDTTKPAPLRPARALKHVDVKSIGISCFLRNSYDLMTQTEKKKVVMKDRIN